MQHHLGPYGFNTPDPSPSPAQHILGALPQLLPFSWHKKRPWQQPLHVLFSPAAGAEREMLWQRESVGQPYLLPSSRFPGVGISLDVCHREKPLMGLRDGEWR